MDATAVIDIKLLIKHEITTVLKQLLGMGQSRYMGKTYTWEQIADSCKNNSVLILVDFNFP